MSSKNLKSTNLKSKDHTFIITDDVLIKYIEYLRNHYISKGEEKEFKARIKGRKTYDEINRAFPESLREAFIKDISTKSNEDNKSLKNTNSIILQSKNELIRTCIKRGNEDKIKKLIPDYDDNYELKYIVNIFKDINKNKNNFANKIKRGPYKQKQIIEYFFITLCPFNNNIKDLINIMDILLKRNNYFGFCSYVFEQRGDNIDNIGEGGHIHILCNKNIKKSVFIYQLFKSIHKFCNNESIDIKIIPECDRNTVELYMQGHKTPSKMDKVRLDIIWRNNNNIKDNIFCIDNKTILKPLIFKQEKTECELFFIGDYKYIQVVINGETKLLKID